MTHPWPARGQQSPDYWDDMLRAYVDAAEVHEAKADPHPQYATNAEADAAAGTAIANHEAAADPHPQYLTEADASALYETLGHGTLAYAENTAGAYTYLTTADLPVPGVVVVVPPTEKDVWIEYQFGIQVVVGGQGVGMASIYETTGGTAVLAGWSRTQSFTTGQAATANGPYHFGKFPVGPSDTTRVFVLYAKHIQDGSSLALAIQNTTWAPTWMRAVA